MTVPFKACLKNGWNHALFTSSSDLSRCSRMKSSSLSVCTIL